MSDASDSAASAGGVARDRRSFLREVVGGLSAAALAQACSRGREGRERPNVVLVVADDLGIDALSPWGGRGYHTPNLERLCAEGTRFETVWATPLCSPSRVEFLTGLYPCRTGWTRNIEDRMADPSDGVRFLDPGAPSFARLLRDAGYRTFLCGKWQLALFHEHPDHPERLGFEEHLCWTWLRRGGGKESERTSRYWDPAIFRDGRDETVEGRYGPDLFLEGLLDFIDRRRDEPFCALWNMVLPHPPFQPTPRQLGPGRKPERATSAVEFFRPMLVYLDDLLGRLVDGIDRLGLGEDTLLLFTSDNGTPPDVTIRFGDGSGHGGKGVLTELGTRVPLIARRPGSVPAGKVSSALVDFSDVLPTLAELAGVRPKTETDGVSFASVLAGGEGKREWIFSQLGDRRCLRDERFKVYDDGRLFEVAVDPFETRDLADQFELVSVRERLLAALRSVCG